MVRRMLARALCTLFAVACLLPASAAAQGGQPESAAPLPASDYSVRPVCPPPTPGRASCLALELVPDAAEARAHTHPIGITRSLTASTAGAGEVCRPRLASEGCWGLRPQDLHSAYALPTTTTLAQTQTVGIVDAYDDPKAEADLKIFDEEFHLPACTTENGCFTKINEEGKRRPLPEANGAWAMEVSLDIETAHAICQNCRILLVEAENENFQALERAELRAVTAGATEISNSWFEEEPAIDSAAFDDPGIVITAAAGDSGYLNWGLPQEKGFVYYPASSPHVVAVGGTQLVLSSVSDTWQNEVWNGDGATGGGCSDHFTAAPWQQTLTDWWAVGCGEARAVADVAADADPLSGVAIYDSHWTTLGGTSLASPLIAASFALAGGARGVPYPARTLYENEIRIPASLQDIESGSNGECSKHSPSETPCTAVEEAASCSEQLICLAGPGYDGPSGVGTPDGIAAFEPPAEPVKKPQLIRFTSSPPLSATVGGGDYAVSATSSSGLAVALSSASPSVCSVAGSSVSFVGAGTCTIAANRAGNSEFDPAPEAQQSFPVTGPPLSSSLVLAFSSSLAPPVVARPNSDFSLRSKPRVDRRSGAITFTVSLADAGTMTWSLTFPNGKFGFLASDTRCKRLQIEFERTCRAAAVVFARGRMVVAQAGVASFTVKPDAAARAALEDARKAGRALPLTATLTFQSAPDGSAVSHTRLLSDRLGR